MKILHATLVPGYGCHQPPEWIGYMESCAIPHLNENKSELVSFSGAFTQRKTAPNVSEAQLMHDYVIPKLTYKPRIICLDEAAYTTLENVRNFVTEINHMIEVDVIDAANLSVTCEATRALKVDMLFKYYWSRRVDIKTASWELQPAWKEIADTIKTFFAMRFPPLAAFLRWKRLRRAERI